MGLVEHSVQRDAFAMVSGFRSELYACLTARSDALFDLCDALLCTDGPVRTLVDLALAPEHRRGHGALYSGINRGRIDVARLRRALAGVPLPRASDGRLVLAVDVSPWLRPDADTCSDRSFCHTFGRGLGKHQMVPGWPYSIVAALETGRTSWTALLDAIRLEPGADLAAVTAHQVRAVIERLVEAGQWQESDLDVLVVLDAGYDAPRIAHLLNDLPVEVLGRLRSDRVMRKPVPVPWICPPQGGRPPKHGGEFVFGRRETWGEPDAVTVTNTDRYGTATALAWDRLHPRLTRRAAWGDHEGTLPIIEGTVIRLSVEKLPSGGVNKPVWLWWSGTGAATKDVDRCWRSFLRRFDVEHTFRLLIPAAPVGQSYGAAGAAVALVGEAFEAGFGQGVEDAVGAGDLDVVDGAGQGGRGPQQSPHRIGDDLHVHAVFLVFPGVEGPVGRCPVDRQQRAVQHHERLGGGSLHRFGEGRRESGG